MEGFERIELRPCMKVDVMATLRSIPAGKSAVFSITEIGTLDKVRAAQWRAKREGVITKLRTLNGGLRYEIGRVAAGEKKEKNL